MCNASKKQKPHDPNAPYDGYDESDDTREKARTIRLEKVVAKMLTEKTAVQETALIPLAIRANETERKMARIHDDKAIEIVRELDVDTGKLDRFFSHEGVIARTILLRSGFPKIKL